MKKLLTFFFAAALFAACNDNDDNIIDVDYEYEVDWPTSEFVALGDSVMYKVERTGYENIEYNAPDGWQVTETASVLKIKAPKNEGDDVKTSGKVTIKADEKGHNFTITLDVYSGIVVGFEDVPQDILAVDKYGANFYSTYGPAQYTEYTDPSSSLYFYINEAEQTWLDPPVITAEFWNGGTVFSPWNEDLKDGSADNQCTVNYVDSKTGKGGHNGSEVFGVVYCDTYSGTPTVIEFTDGKDHVLDHFWVMNTVYTSYVIEKGNDIGKNLEDKKGYFYGTATGYDKDGKKTSSVAFYLADFRTADSPGLIKEWLKVDLSGLGKVNKIEFTMDGSDYEYDILATPAYFCFDDIAIRK